ncbi:pts family oligomeric beta-glucoside porter component iic [Liquorilactobacillus ghanensis DSM 18630]|uniref:Permease IIC component n=1 Tax=Liquorilactobacillus ghanensis DSM 18630 TaxID=1423750 RepID=A0A0R1VVV5_9LACO|nr:PTS transporter subunit EIIC [Liquorilactobacillus ghanensis]KRM05708.1 pts family oligomeric beta-glucoside porter component iic [Liquorilactobacillus ghanensis DSM 18630]
MKDKVKNFFNKISPVLNRIGSNKYLQTITAAMMATLGPTILGSFAILLGVWAGNEKWTKIATIANNIGNVTINLLALYIVFLIAKNLVPHFLENDDGNAAGIIAMMSFFILTPMGQIKDGNNLINALPTTWLASQGVFSAMIVGVLVARLYVFIKQHGWTIKMPAGVPPMVSDAFATLIPALVCGIISGLISFGFLFTDWGSFHQMIYSLIQVPLRGLGGSLGAMILISLLQQIIWFFGIHGSNVVMPIVTPIWLSMDMQNLAALQAGKPLPNIIGLAFFQIITWSGTALGLVLLMLIARSKRYRDLGRLAIVPALFGVTEPIIFGTPLVLNFDLAVPFITNNTIALIIGYIVTRIGWVARFPGVQQVFGLPIGFHAAVEGKVSIIVLQLIIQLIISPLLWYPWLRHADNKALKLEKDMG